MNLPFVSSKMSDCGDSFSFLSTQPDVQTIYTPSETEQSTDGLEILSHDEQYAPWDEVSSSATSVQSNAYEHEIAHGRRYHGFEKGRYPLPNDIEEQKREETVHAMLLELLVCHRGPNPRRRHRVAQQLVEWPIILGGHWGVSPKDH
jgi:hypothetical protein